MSYHEISIRPAHGRFGEYECLPDTGEVWADLNDLLDEARGNVGDIYELGMDTLPDGVEDIRGLIHEEPSHVYAYLDGEGHAQYFGVAETEAPS